MTKITLVCDTECYVNFWMVGFRRVDNGRTRFFELREERDITLDTAAIAQIMRQYRIVTFNGRNYDLPMIVTALRGASNAELKHTSDRLIKGSDGQGIKWWQVERELGISVPSTKYWDHIDLAEPAPGVRIPLKLYGARMHSARLQDLPVEASAHLTDEQVETTRDYNLNNDLPMTVDMWNALSTEIELREHIGTEYNLDVRSMSDGQMATAMVKKMLVKERGGLKIPDSVFDPDFTFKYVAPAFIQFKSPELNAVLDLVQSLEFTLSKKGKPIMPPKLRSLKIKIGAGVYTMGMGGLHSTEKRQVVKTDEFVQIEDDDVASYYPKLILICGLFPKNIGPVFLKVFADIVKRRLDAKAKGQKKIADSLKIAANSIYGLLGSIYSVFFAPDAMLQVTLTGQLMLLMLIEMMEEAGIKAVSANTDGVISMVPRHLANAKTAVMQAWQKQTGFDTENTKYDAVYSRDVNSYIAIKPDGSTKRKGSAYGATSLSKNPSGEISIEAVIAHLKHGTPIRQTIESCTDIKKFVNARRVTGGAVCGDQYLGRVVRSYKSIFAVNKITYASGKKQGHKVPDSDPVWPIMVLPDSLPNDIDYQFYIDIAEGVLVDLGVKSQADIDGAARRELDLLYKIEIDEETEV